MLADLIEVGVIGIYPKDKIRLDPHEGVMVAPLKPASVKAILEALYEAAESDPEQAALLSIVQAFRSHPLEPQRRGFFGFLHGQAGLQGYVYAPTRVMPVRLANRAPQVNIRAGARIFAGDGSLNIRFLDIGVTRGRTIVYSHGEVDLGYRGMNQGNHPFYPFAAVLEPDAVLNRRNFQMLDRLLSTYGPPPKS